ncbi:hypothetical protein B0J14DRAFT_652765 [Halenospora varia]|nr:hypothetical protein B0J14DRAFT_652765 [Halenospora varia]
MTSNSSQGADFNGYVNTAFGYNSPSSTAQPAAQPQTDGLPPRNLDLSFPDWLTGGRNADTPYAPLPFFSTGIFTPEDDDSLNYWDSHCKAEPYSQPAPLASPTLAIDVTQGNPPTSNVSYIPLSLVTALPASTAQDEDDNSDMTNVTSPLNVPSSSSKTTESSRIVPKAAWEGSNDSRQSPNPGRHSSRLKEQRGTRPRRKSFPSSAPTGHQLRGVRTRPRKEADNDAEAENGRVPTPRVAHNMIEKQYRTRLNMQFTNLLEAIPPEAIGTQFDGYVDAGGQRGKVSKGDVLTLAKRYIQMLEQDKKSLEGENREYKKSISRLRAAWAKNGGWSLV